MLLPCIVFKVSPKFAILFVALTFRSPRERLQSLGKRSGEVGRVLEGTCTPVAAAGFMLPFVGSAAAGGKKVRGNKHASEDGPLKSETGKKKSRCSVTTFIYDFLQLLHLYVKKVQKRGEQRRTDK